MKNMHEKDNQDFSVNPIDAKLDKADRPNLKKAAKTGAVAGLIAGAALSIYGPSNEEDAYERGVAEQVADQQNQDYQDIIDGEADPLDPTLYGVPAPEGAPNATVREPENGQMNPLYDGSLDASEGTNYGTQNPEKTEASDELNVPLDTTRESN